MRHPFLTQLCLALPSGITTFFVTTLPFYRTLASQCLPFCVPHCLCCCPCVALFKICGKADANLSELAVTQKPSQARRQGTVPSPTVLSQGVQFRSAINSLSQTVSESSRHLYSKCLLAWSPYTLFMAWKFMGKQSASHQQTETTLYLWHVFCPLPE